MPAQPYVLRPIAWIAVSSQKMIPAPPVANFPRCTKCQSVGPPFSDEYWHIGDTTMRLRALRPRSAIGAKSRGVVVRTSVRDESMTSGALKCATPGRHAEYVRKL